jgi:hypothetical protein
MSSHVIADVMPPRQHGTLMSSLASRWVPNRRLRHCSLPNKRWALLAPMTYMSHWIVLNMARLATANTVFFIISRVYVKTRAFVWLLIRRQCANVLRFPHSSMRATIANTRRPFHRLTTIKCTQVANWRRQLSYQSLFSYLSSFVLSFWLFAWKRKSNPTTNH